MALVSPSWTGNGDGVPEIGWGTYQSPILVQWKGARSTTRALNVRLVKFVYAAMRGT